MNDIQIELWTTNLSYEFHIQRHAWVGLSLTSQVKTLRFWCVDTEPFSLNGHSYDIVAEIAVSLFHTIYSEMYRIFAFAEYETHYS